MTQSNKLIAARCVAIAVAAVCASLSAPVYANDSKALLDLMLKKGVITQKDYDEFLEATKDAAENKAFREQRIDQDVSKAVKYMQKNADAGSVMKNGLGVQSADGANTLQLTGRLHFDARQFQEGPYQDRMEVRRARFGVRGQIMKDFKYELVGDFGISSSSSSGSDMGMSNTFTGTDVAYVDYAAYQPAQLRIGRFKMPFSLEQLTSSNNIDTIERSLMGQVEGEFVPAKETGVMVFGSPQSGLTYAIAASRGRASSNATTSTADYIGRVTANIAELTGNKDYIAHLGYAHSNGEVANGTAITSGRTEAREESGFFSLASGSTLSGVSTRTRQGVEAAFGWQAFKLQAEYFNIAYDDAAAADRKVKGNYIQGVWNLTGETHNYSNTAGTFGGLKVKSPFTLSGGTGAWQLVIRRSELDGNDAGGTLATGKTRGASAWTYGVNWVLNENARVMLNYIKTDFDTAVINSGQSLLGQEAIVLRGQLAF